MQSIELQHLQPALSIHLLPVALAVSLPPLQSAKTTLHRLATALPNLETQILPQNSARRRRHRQSLSQQEEAGKRGTGCSRKVGPIGQKEYSGRRGSRNGQLWTSSQELGYC
jgi:hypothetical protein